MNRKSFFVTLTAVLAVACLVFFISSVRQSALQSQVGSPINTGLDRLSGAGYIVKDYGGKVAVFFPDKNTPEVVFDTYTKYLPEADQIQIRKGIPVPDYASLVKLIEDFTS